MKNAKQIFKVGCISAVCAWFLSACSEPKYPTPPFEQVLDLSKSGVIYEQNFTVPSNREWAPQRLEFGQSHTNYEIMLRFTDMVVGRYEREDKEADKNFSKENQWNKVFSRVTLYRVMGMQEPRKPMTVEEEKTYLPVLAVEGAPIVLRLTLTPLSNVSKPLGYRLGLHAVSGSRTEIARGESMDVTLDLSKYGFSGNPPTVSDGKAIGKKELMSLFPLDVGGSYHLRIENINPPQLPHGIQTELVMELGRWKF